MVKEKAEQGGGLVPLAGEEDHVPEGEETHAQTHHPYILFQQCSTAECFIQRTCTTAANCERQHITLTFLQIKAVKLISPPATISAARGGR